MIGVLFQNMLERLQGSPWIVLFKGKLALTESCVLILRIVSQRLFGESFGVLMIAAKERVQDGISGCQPRLIRFRKVSAIGLRRYVVMSGQIQNQPACPRNRSLKEQPGHLGNIVVTDNPQGHKAASENDLAGPQEGS